MDKTVAKAPSVKPSVNKAASRQNVTTKTRARPNPLSSSSPSPRDQRAVSKEVTMRQETNARPASRKGSRLATSPLHAEITDLVNTSAASIFDMERKRVSNLMGKSCKISMNVCEYCSFLDEMGEMMISLSHQRVLFQY